MRLATSCGILALLTWLQDDVSTSTTSPANPEGAPPPMGCRPAPRVRRSGELFRPRKPFRLARCAAGRIRNLRGNVRLFAQRLQLDLRPPPTSLRAFARPFWCPTRRNRQHNYLERGLVRRGPFRRDRRVVCLAAALGDRRGPDVSRLCESHRLLVSQGRAQPGNRNVRRRGEILFGYRDTGVGSRAPAFRLALEFCGHRRDQRSLFRAVLRLLSQSERRQTPLQHRVRVHRSWWSATGRSRARRQGRASRLFAAAAPSVGTCSRLRVVQLQLLPAAYLAAELSVYRSSRGSASFGSLHQCSLAHRHTYGFDHWRMACRCAHPARLEPRSRSPGRAYRRDGARAGRSRRGKCKRRRKRAVLDQRCVRRLVRSIPGRMVNPLADCSERKRRHGRRNPEFLQSSLRNSGADRDRLRGAGNTLFFLGLRGRGHIPADRNRRLRFPPGINGAGARARLIRREATPCVLSPQGRSRNSLSSIWKSCTPFSRRTEYRPRSYVAERNPRCTLSHKPMSSCCTSSLNCTALFTRSCILHEPASWKNHSKMVSVFSCEIGRIRFVETLS